MEYIPDPFASPPFPPELGEEPTSKLILYCRPIRLHRETPIWLRRQPLLRSPGMVTPRAAVFLRLSPSSFIWRPAATCRRQTKRFRRNKHVFLSVTDKNEDLQTAIGSRESLFPIGFTRLKKDSSNIPETASGFLSLHV